MGGNHFMKDKDLIIMITSFTGTLQTSNADSIRVNHYDDAYWIVFTTTEFGNIAPSQMANIAKAIIDLFNKNTPDTMINVSVVTKGVIMTNIILERIGALKKLCKMMNHFGNFNYVEVENTNVYKEIPKPTINHAPVKPLIKEANADDNNDIEGIKKFLGITDNLDEDDLYDDEDEDDDEDDDDSYEEDEYNPYEQFEKKYYEVTGKPFKGKKKKKNNKKSFYGTSRVWKNSDNIKRSINRHGVIVGTKKDVKSDEETIKQFLKDFLPGKKSWQKQFRKELLDRWMNMFVIQKKQLKKYEQKYRAEQHRKSTNQTAKKVIGLASSLFTKPIDEWADPNR